jgi:hypothetical protein
MPRRRREESDPEVGQEELHQQRRALEDLHVEADQPLGNAPAGQAQEKQQAAHDAAADEGDQRQHDGPPQRQQQVAQDVPEGEVGHARLSVRRSTWGLPS